MDTDNKGKVLPVYRQKHTSYTYWRTGQPWMGLGAWLTYQEDKLKKAFYV